MIILDNGHGNDTPGKRSPVWSDGTQLFEWEFTRAIVKQIFEGLEELGIDSTILVPEENDISLSERVKRANIIYKANPDAYLISVHGNAAAEPNQGAGWEVWTSPGQTKSDAIAEIFFEFASGNLPMHKMRSDKSDGDNDKESKFYILVKTKCPAILTENLFYDNEKECRFMMSDYGKQRISQLHVEAIIKYLQQ